MLHDQFLFTFYELLYVINISDGLLHIFIVLVFRILKQDLFNPFEAETLLNNITRIQSVPQRNTKLHITKINWLLQFKETITIYIET